MAAKGPYTGSKAKAAARPGPLNGDRIHPLKELTLPAWNLTAVDEEISSNGGVYVGNNRDRAIQIYLLNHGGNLVVDISSVPNPANGAALGTLAGIAAQYCDGIDVVEGTIVKKLDSSRLVGSIGEMREFIAGRSTAGKTIFYNLRTRVGFVAPPSRAARPGQFAAANVPGPATAAVPQVMPGQALTYGNRLLAAQPELYACLRRELHENGVKILLDEEVDEGLKREVAHAQLPTTTRHEERVVYVYPTVRGEDGEWRVPACARDQVARHRWVAMQKQGAHVEQRWLTLCLTEDCLIPIDL